MGKGGRVGLAILTAAVAFVGCYSTSGDNDEVGGSSGGGGRGGTSTGGGGASGGFSPRGGTSGGGAAAVGGSTTAGSTSGGSTGTAGATSQSGNVGRHCITDAECGEGLSCVERDDTVTLGGAPPGGLCTTSCASHDTCLQYSASAWCYPFESGSYCIEGCAMDSGIEGKCHDRLDFVCDVAAVQPLGTTCDTIDDCPAESVCSGGVCNAALMVCVPSCGSDADCDAGLYCDYRSGLCQATAPLGKAFNESCDPAAIDADGCLGGICLETYEVPTEGSCSGSCNLGNAYACGYTGDGPADSACLYDTMFSGVAVETGDLGYCGELCDCDDECGATGEACFAFTDSGLVDIWQREGYCRPNLGGGEFNVPIGPCGAGGTGNAGAGGVGGAP